MIRDEVLDAIHAYATSVAFTAADGYLSVRDASYNEYCAKFRQGMTDLMRDDDLVPANLITADIYYRYQHMNLWSETDLLTNTDQHITRDVEYDIAQRKGRKARDAYWAKWDPITLPGDEATTNA